MFGSGHFFLPLSCKLGVAFPGQIRNKLAPNSHQIRIKFGPNSRFREFNPNLVRIWCEFGASLIRGGPGADASFSIGLLWKKGRRFWALGVVRGRGAWGLSEKGDPAGCRRAKRLIHHYFDGYKRIFRLHLQCIDSRRDAFKVQADNLVGC